jgi:hypothetical protein
MVTSRVINDARDEEPAALQVRVEPGARLDVHRRPALAAPVQPVAVVALDHAPQVVDRHQRGIGVAPVDDDLQKRRIAEQQVAAELRPDVHHHQHLARIDQRRDLPVRSQRRDPLEVRRAVEGGHHLARRGAGILVVQSVGNAIQVEGGRVAEHQQLDERRDDEHETPAPVLEQGQELLAHERADALPHGRARPTPGACASCARSGRGRSPP